MKAPVAPLLRFSSSRAPTWTGPLQLVARAAEISLNDCFCKPSMQRRLPTGVFGSRFDTVSADVDFLIVLVVNYVTM